MKKLSESYYDKSKGYLMKQLRELAPEQYKAFLQFDREAFKPGVLTKKEKEIIAVAIAHVIECPYCIDVHTKKAKKQGATLPELTEAVFVVASLKAGLVIQQLLNITDESSNRLKAYSNFSESTLKEGKLNEKLKVIIAIAVSLVINEQKSIHTHKEYALKLGISQEEISEALFVTAALKAGGAYGHIIQLIDSYIE